MSIPVTKSQATNHSAHVPWKRIVWSAIKLNLTLGVILLVQRALFGITTGVIPLAEVLAASFLMSWQFVVREAPSRFFWHGKMLGVMANVWRIGLFLVVPGIETREFTLFGALILFGCMAGGFVASRR